MKRELFLWRINRLNWLLTVTLAVGSFICFALEEDPAYAAERCLKWMCPLSILAAVICVGRDIDYQTIKLSIFREPGWKALLNKMVIIVGWNVYCLAVYSIGLLSKRQPIAQTFFILACVEMCLICYELNAVLMIYSFKSSLAGIIVSILLITAERRLGWLFLPENLTRRAIYDVLILEETSFDTVGFLIGICLTICLALCLYCHQNLSG